MNIAIVTGASSGMGREFVLQLSAYVQVDEIWAIARRKEQLEALQAHCSVPVRAISLDLCEESSFDAYAARLAEEAPNVKLLVNAAGFGKFKAFPSSYSYTSGISEISIGGITVSSTSFDLTTLIFPLQD